MESVGRLFVKLGKGKRQGKWPNLMKLGQDKPPNMTYWWEMHENYETELREWDEVHGDDEDGEWALKDKKKKKKKDKSKKVNSCVINRFCCGIRREKKQRRTLRQMLEGIGIASLILLTGFDYLTVYFTNLGVLGFWGFGVRKLGLGLGFGGQG